MHEIIELSHLIKTLSKQRNEIIPEIEKLPKEYITLISKFKLITDTLEQLQHQFDALIPKAPHKK